MHAKAFVSSEVVSRLATANAVSSKVVAVISEVFPTKGPFITHSVLIGIAAVKVAAVAAAAIANRFMFFKNVDFLTFFEFKLYIFYFNVKK